MEFFTKWLGGSPKTEEHPMDENIHWSEGRATTFDHRYNPEYFRFKDWDSKGVEQAKTLSRLLYDQHPDDLRDTDVHLGLQHIASNIEKLRRIERMTLPEKNYLRQLENITRDAEKNGIPADKLYSYDFPASFLPALDAVNAPTQRLSVLAHELGHAIDFNNDRKSDPLWEKILRKFTLKREHDAWNLSAISLAGAYAALEDSAKGQKDGQLIKDTLYDMEQDKRPALGSYWGYGIGGTLGGGVGGIYGSNKIKELYGRFGGKGRLGKVLTGLTGALGGYSVGSSVGAIPGAFSGLAIGEWLTNKNKDEDKAFVDSLLKRVKNNPKVTPEEPLIS